MEAGVSAFDAAYAGGGGGGPGALSSSSHSAAAAAVGHQRLAQSGASLGGAVGRQTTLLTDSTGRSLASSNAAAAASLPHQALSALAASGGGVGGHAMSFNASFGGVGAQHDQGQAPAVPAVPTLSQSHVAWTGGASRRGGASAAAAAAASAAPSVTGLSLSAAVQSDDEPPSAEQFGVLQDALKKINNTLTTDETLLAWDDLHSVHHHRELTSAGTTEDPSRVVLQELPFHAQLPTVLKKQLEHVRYQCFFGVIPELGRAWVTVDSKLYLWQYGGGSDLTSYTQLNQIILAVALVPVKPGYFVDEIRHLLVVATPVEVVLLGVQLNRVRRRSEYDELVLVPTQLSVSTDEVNFTRIVGTPLGRIFLSGDDGSLYEIEYRDSESWFSSKCRKVNRSQSRVMQYLPKFMSASTDGRIEHVVFDRFRNYLYALTDRLVLQVHDLGADGRSFERTAAIGVRDMQEGEVVVHMAVVSPFETRDLNVHVMLVTSHGTRVLFAAMPRVADYRQANRQRVSDLHQYVVRSMRGDRQDTVSAAYYGAGLSVLCRQARSTNQHLPTASLCVQACIAESTTGASGVADVTERDQHPPLFPNTGAAVYAVSEEPLDVPFECIPIQHNAALLQFNMTPRCRRVLIVDQEGVRKYDVLTPLGLLQGVLANDGRQHAEAVLRGLHQRYAPAEVVAMLLRWATLDEAQWDSVAEFVGIVAQWQPDSDAPRFVETGQTEILDDVGQALFTPHVQHSSRYRGLFLCLARLLRPLWHAPLMAADVRDRMLIFNVEEPLVKEAVRAVSQLLRFLEKNNMMFPHASTLNMATRPTMRTGSVRDAVYQMYQEHSLGNAFKLEEWATSELAYLMRRVCQGYEFISIIANRLRSRFVDLDKLYEDKSTVALLNTSQYSHFFADIGLAHRLTRVLIYAGFSAERGQGDTDLDDELITRTPLYFSQKDRDGQQAMHRLRDMSVENVRDVEPLVRQLERCVDGESLSEVCDLLVRRQLFHLVPGLVSKYIAREVDPSDVVSYEEFKHVDAVRRRAPPVQLRAMTAQDVRNLRDRRRAVTNAALIAYDSMCKVCKPTDDMGQLFVEEMNKIDDRVMHYALYELIASLHGYEMGKMEFVCGFKFVHEWLQQQFDVLNSVPGKETADFAGVSELLVKYYELQRQFGKAADTLVRTATSETQPLSIEYRVKCLQRACSQAEQHPRARGGDQDASLQEQAMYVYLAARVQAKTLARIKECVLLLPDELDDMLSRRLLKAHELFSVLSKRHPLVLALERHAGNTIRPIELRDLQLELIAARPTPDLATIANQAWNELLRASAATRDRARLASCVLLAEHVANSTGRTYDDILYELEQFACGTNAPWVAAMRDDSDPVGTLWFCLPLLTMMSRTFAFVWTMTFNAWLRARETSASMSSVEPCLVSTLATLLQLWLDACDSSGGAAVLSRLPAADARKLPEARQDLRHAGTRVRNNVNEMLTRAEQLSLTDVRDRLRHCLTRLERTLLLMSRV